MDLSLNTKLAKNYKSPSQIARVLTEAWTSQNAFCPNCGEGLSDFENNRPVADFYCPHCQEEFELKSKKGAIGKKIVDGAYDTMISRIQDDNNPHFFFLTYTKEWKVNNFLIIPRYFFTSHIIIKRKPLPITAKRAGWVGCNIDMAQIPSLGKIFFVKNEQLIPPWQIKDDFNKILFLKQKNHESKGWLLDIMNCIERMKKQSFTLEDIYKFEAELKQKHPHNNFIKDKIRQQLQILRDKGLIEFIERGKYRRINNPN